MKPSHIVVALAAFLLAACSASDWHRDYDAEICNSLAVKIDGHQPLTQDDYASMIAQNEDILKYIIKEVLIMKKLKKLLVIKK